MVLLNEALRSAPRPVHSLGQRCNPEQDIPSSRELARESCQPTQQSRMFLRQQQGQACSFIIAARR